jgi:hypothetical protein
MKLIVSINDSLTINITDLFSKVETIENAIVKNNSHLQTIKQSQYEMQQQLLVLSQSERNQKFEEAADQISEQVRLSFSDYYQQNSKLVSTMAQSIIAEFHSSITPDKDRTVQTISIQSTFEKTLSKVKSDVMKLNTQLSLQMQQDLISNEHILQILHHRSVEESKALQSHFDNALTIFKDGFSSLNSKLLFSINDQMTNIFNASFRSYSDRHDNTFVNLQQDFQSALSNLTTDLSQLNKESVQTCVEAFSDSLSEKLKIDIKNWFTNRLEDDHRLQSIQNSIYSLSKTISDQTPRSEDDHRLQNIETSLQC